MSDELRQAPTLTLYRPVGTVEITLIEDSEWRAFPPMPFGHRFHYFARPPDDPRSWAETLRNPDRAWEVDPQEEDVIKSWIAWGNDPGVAYVVWFEVGEKKGSFDRPYSVTEMNAALVGPISIYARYGSAD